MGAIVAGLATFAIIIAFGWALVRFGGVPTGADTVLTRVCFFSATPALIFVTLRQADLEALFSATVLVRQRLGWWLRQLWRGQSGSIRIALARRAIPICRWPRASRRPKPPA